MPVPARVDEAGRRVDQQAEPAEGALPFESRDEIVREPDAFQRGAQNELARMEDERRSVLDLDELGQVLLRLANIDIGVAGVVENPEIAIDADVHARRLEQGIVVGIDLDAAFLQATRDRPIGEDHGADSTADRPLLVFQHLADPVCPPACRSEFAPQASAGRSSRGDATGGG